MEQVLGSARGMQPLRTAQLLCQDESDATTSLDRRWFLKSVAITASVTAGVLQAGLARAQSDVVPDISKNIIDSHVHVWTPNVEAYPLASGFQKTEMKPPSFTPDELFAHCRVLGVQQVVLIQMSFYKFDNRYLLDAIEQYPKTFRGVAVIDESQPDACQTMRSLARRGVTGFRLYAIQKRAANWLDSPAIAAMWNCAADSGQAICLLTDVGALPVIRELCQRHPRTPVVIDHFARIGMSGTIDSTNIDQLCSFAEFPNVYIKTSAFYALGKKKPPYDDLAPLFRRVLAGFGADRLMWGSDAPFQVQNGHTYADSLSFIQSGLPFLTAEDKSYILRKTAAKVLMAEAGISGL